MNKIFKVIWNHTTQSWVAVSELTSAKGKTKSKTAAKLTALSLVAGSALMAGNAMGATATGVDGLVVIDKTGADATTYADVTDKQINQVYTQTTTASGKNSISIGNNVLNASAEGIVIGTNAHSGGNSPDSILIGRNANNYISGRPSPYLGMVGIGRNVTVNGSESVGIGPDVEVTRHQTVAIGYRSNGLGDAGVALGREAVEAAGESVSIGYKSLTTSQKSHAIGSNALTLAGQSTAIGNSAITKAGNSLAIGNNSKSYAGSGIAMGLNAYQDAGNAIAMGANAQSHGGNSIAFGNTAYVSPNGSNNISIGNAASNTREYTVSIGDSSSGNANNAVALGRSSTVTGGNSIAIGYNANAGLNTTDVTAYNKAVTDYKTADNEYYNQLNAYETAYKAILDGTRNDPRTRAATIASETATLKELLKTVNPANTDATLNVNQTAVETARARAGNATNVSVMNAIRNYSGSDAKILALKDLLVNETTGVDKRATERTTALNALRGIAGYSTETNAIAVGYKAGAAGLNTLAVGTGTAVQANNSGAFGANNTILSKNAYVVGSNIYVGDAGSVSRAGAVVLGDSSDGGIDYSSKEKTDSGLRVKAVNSATVGNYTYSGFAGNLGGTDTNGNPSNAANDKQGRFVSIGSSGSERQIKHVAAGEISATSTDAINGSQLYLVAHKLGNGPVVYTDATGNKLTQAADGNWYPTGSVFSSNGNVYPAGTTLNADGNPTDSTVKAITPVASGDVIASMNNPATSTGNTAGNPYTLSNVGAGANVYGAVDSNGNPLTAVDANGNVLVPVIAADGTVTYYAANQVVNGVPVKDAVAVTPTSYYTADKFNPTTGKLIAGSTTATPVTTTTATPMQSSVLAAKRGLADLSSANPTNAITVADARNMGWVVSANNTLTDATNGTSNTTPYAAAVKNSNEVRFTGTGVATVSGKTDDNGVRTINVHVDAQAVSESAQNPVVYTTADGTKLKKVGNDFYPVSSVVNDGKAYPSDSVVIGGKVYPKGTTQDQVTDGTAKEATQLTATPVANVIASMNNAVNRTTTPMALSNVGAGAETFDAVDKDGNSLVKVGDKYYPAGTVEIDGKAYPAGTTAEQVTAGTATEATASTATPLALANDGKWYDATKIDSNGQPQTGATAEVNPPKNVGTSGLVDFAKSNPTNAATVKDLQNMGWVISTSDNEYEDQVRNANKVNFKGENGIKVSGNTDANGVRNIVISMEKGEVIKKDELIGDDGKTYVNKDGKIYDKDAIDPTTGDVKPNSNASNPLVKDGDKYKQGDVTYVNVDGKLYKDSEIDPTTGKLKDEKTQPSYVIADNKVYNPSDVTGTTPNANTTPVTVVDNAGSRFVDGNTVAQAIQESGWTVGKAKEALASDKFENKDEKVNPNDEVRFAAGKGVEINTATVKKIDDKGEVSTTTVVKFDVDVPIDYASVTNKAGDKLVKANDGNWYKADDVNADGSLKTTTNNGTTVTPTPVAAEDVVKKGATLSDSESSVDNNPYKARDYATKAGDDAVAALAATQAYKDALTTAGNDAVTTLQGTEAYKNAVDKAGTDAVAALVAQNPQATEAEKTQASNAAKALKAQELETPVRNAAITAKATDLQTPVRDKAVADAKTEYANNPQLKDQIVEGTNGVQVNNVGWATNPDQAVNKDQLDQTVNKSGFFVQQNGKSTVASTKGETDPTKSEKVTPNDVVNFVDGKGTKVTAETRRDENGVDTTTISVDVDTSTMKLPTVYTDVNGNKVVEGNDGKYYRPEDLENGVPKNSDVKPVDNVVVSVNNPNAGNNTAGNATQLSNIAAGANTMVFDANGDQYVKVGDKYYKPSDFTNGKLNANATEATPAQGASKNPVDVAKTNLADLDNSNPTNAMTVEDAKNLGWVVSTSDNNFAGAVKNANQVDFKAEAGTGVTVKGSVVNGIQTVTVGNDYAKVNSTAAPSKATGAESVAIGGDSQANVENSVAIGKGATVTNAAPKGSVAIGPNAIVEGKAHTGPYSINGGNVAGKTGDTTRVLSVGRAGDEAQIQNVAPGQVSSTSTDAINGSQLHATNQAIGRLDGKVNRIDKDLRAGVAGANAAAGLPQVYLPGKSMVAASAGTFKGQNAVAIGYSRASDNGKVIFKLQGNANSQGDVGGSVGVGYQW